MSCLGWLKNKFNCQGHALGHLLSAVADAQATLLQ